MRGTAIPAPDPVLARRPTRDPYLPVGEGPRSAARPPSSSRDSGPVRAAAVVVAGPRPLRAADIVGPRGTRAAAADTAVSRTGGPYARPASRDRDGGGDRPRMLVAAGLLRSADGRRRRRRRRRRGRVVGGQHGEMLDAWVAVAPRATLSGRVRDELRTGGVGG